MWTALQILIWGIFMSIFTWEVHGMEIQMDQTDANRQYCAGMYSRNTWGGPVDPFILVKFLNDSVTEVDDPIAALVMFEWKDRDFIGVPDPQINANRLALCDENYIKSGACNTTDRGEFILAANATENSNALILSKAVHLKNPRPIHYSIQKTGYYCLVTDGFNVDKYVAVVEFRNAYGELSATQVPKLPFYGGITLLYALMAVYWGFLYYQHRHDILPVQNYITAILIFLVVEMLMTWGFYDYNNRNGSNVGSKALLIIVGILNAARNSFTFFLLLIVCMGYGVVKPTLGRAMIYVRGLAATHFIFGLIYAITNLLIPPENAGLVSLLTGLPLAATMTAFYIWTLNSLTSTLKDLRERKQHVKEAMYRKLWWAILATVIFIFAFVLFNSFSIAAISDPSFFPQHWKTRWFILDGWLNIVYLVDVAWIAYVWRPTVNNRRFAMSDEIAQDDDGNFEIGDIGVPDGFDDGDEDDEAHIEARRDRRTQTMNERASHTLHQTLPQQASSSHLSRESLAGETIFAIGEDGDKLSDVGSDENRKLVR